MPKTLGAETINKRINWRVMLGDGEERIYPNLISLCGELNIHRSSVYKIANGKTKPVRKKNIINIEKIVNEL